MEALVRRGLQSPDQALRLLGVARAICVGLSRSLPALAASAEQFAEQYPKLKLKVNGREVTVPEGTSVLNACREAGAYVPTLCTHPRLPTTPGTCRICMVETGGGQLKPACATPAWEGMEVQTATDKVQESIRGVLSLMKANHPSDCMNCDASGRCEFQDLISRYNVKDADFEHFHDSSSTALTLDLEKCIKCGRCVTMCGQVQQMNVLGMINRSRMAHPGVLIEEALDHSKCIECGQCSSVCPVGAIVEHSEWRQVLDALENKQKVMVVQTAPSVRVSIGEELGLAPGTVETGQMVAAQRALGFDYVFDSDFSADLTIMEEGEPGWGGGGWWVECAHGHAPGPLPMFTSCCPAWINLVEKSYPELIPHLSSCKSPQMMMGAVVKHYWAKKKGLKPEDVCLVGIMPCTAKKHETERKEFRNENGAYDCDYVITTREFGHMLRHKKIPMPSLKPEEFDNPLGEATGAAALFGATGGVMEAAIRTAYEIAAGEPLPKLEVEAVRGVKGVKEATLTLPANDTTLKAGVAGKEIRVAVASGIGNARHLLQRIQAGEAHYDFVEVMACPGGCIGGGGQPKTHDPDAVLKRMGAIYQVDKSLALRKSHENPSIHKIYAEFLGQPGGELSHKLLHTHYTDHSVDTLPSVRELGGSGEVAKRAALTAAGEMRYKRIAMVGDPSAKR
ncbi:hypothetical protein CHLNCDRAFT_34957 [Chlorella variabilis]|uniref:Uncharacterized protein HYD1 n=1 Tax=Chlorella variabilis TaxID=554065 RepID=E1ZBX9_CHLVA|nr:hypothetical protein CHLNCDRAFT_34957 [Chlorella variabilis]EFN56510.1 hypothetical protein CHLNCDRAFT_34957 [Chlorella variabilis]|eukprot:XP_005848612.1 hypothetical protein CHLNCDRAFT_34957 [Chlorella variabilis]